MLCLMIKPLYTLADKAQRAKSRTQRKITEKQKALKWYLFYVANVATIWMYVRYTFALVSNSSLLDHLNNNILFVKLTWMMKGL